MTSSSQASKTLYVQMTPEYVSSPNLSPGSTERYHCSIPAIMAHTCTHTHRNITQPYRRMASCHVTGWMDLQGVLLSEMSEKDKYCRFHLDVEHKKQKKWTTIIKQRQNPSSKIQRWLPEGRKVGDEWSRWGKVRGTDAQFKTHAARGRNTRPAWGMQPAMGGGQ